jgi:hypothetical protein
LRILLAFLLFLPLSAQQWETLFDGKSFRGWRSPSGQTPMAGAWRIDNKCLIVRPFVSRRTDLWTEASFEEFEMEFEWRVARGANSGVKYAVEEGFTVVVVEEDKKWRRVPGPQSAAASETTIEYTKGLEYQLADDAAEPDAVANPAARAGALYNRRAPTRAAARPAGQWNQSRLIVTHQRIEHWLNGKLVLGVDLPAPRIAIRPGPIALQYHQTEAAFRNLRVRRLS